MRVCGPASASHGRERKPRHNERTASWAPPARRPAGEAKASPPGPAASCFPCLPGGSAADGWVSYPPRGARPPPPPQQGLPPRPRPLVSRADLAPTRGPAGPAGGSPEIPPGKPGASTSGSGGVIPGCAVFPWGPRF